MPKEETFDRIQVLQNATHVFHKKGYNGTSMQDLVDATQLNRSSIYNSFGSKLGIFIEVLSFYQKNAATDIHKKLANTYNAKDAIEGIFEVMLQYILADTDRKGCLLVNCKSEMANQDKKIRAFVEKNQDTMIALLEDIVAKGQMERTFTTISSAHQHALYLYTTIQGLRMTGILNKNEDELRAIIATAIQTLV